MPAPAGAIEHVVLLLMENRPFDMFYGFAQPVLKNKINGLTGKECFPTPGQGAGYKAREFDWWKDEDDDEEGGTPFFPKAGDDDGDDDGDDGDDDGPATALLTKKFDPDGPAEHILEGFLPVPDGPAEHIFEGFLPVPDGPAEHIFWNLLVLESIPKRR